MNLYARFSAGFSARAQCAALQDHARTYRYADVERESARCAAFLAGLGAAPGDRAVVQIAPSSQALFVYLGALRAGLICVPVANACSDEELRNIIANAEPRVTVCRPNAPATAGAPAYSLESDGSGTLRDAVNALPSGTVFSTVERADDEVALILYTAGTTGTASTTGTTGTTGRAKGAMLTHGNLAANAAALRDLWRISEDDVVLPALPLHYYFGLCAAIHPILLAGAALSLQPSTGGDALVGSLRKTTVLIGEPDFYERLLQQPVLGHAACDGIRLCISGAAPLHGDTWTAFHERTGKAILECYGLPEAGIVTSAPVDGAINGAMNGELPNRPGTVGLPLPGVKLRVVGANLLHMPFDHEGEVLLKGPHVFKGYWRMPQETTDAFYPDGSFRTGDLGLLAEEGYITYSGHSSDQIQSGVFTIHPKEVELVLHDLAGVMESAIIGVPHAELGQIAIAVIVRDPATALTEADVMEAIKARLKPFMLPGRVFFVDALPRNAMGRVKKDLLREQHKTLNTA